MNSSRDTLLLSKLAGVLMMLVGIGAGFSGNRPATAIVGVLLIALGGYTIVRAVRPRANGAH